MKSAIGVTILIVGICISTNAMPDGEVHWSYSGDMGPEHWGKLDFGFSTCSSGKNQSPINLTGMIDGEVPEVEVNYEFGGNEILNNGHTIQINYAPGSTITVSGHTFELKQFHFHSPSENTIEGHSYQMEAHFVHADNGGNLAVIAVMFEPGERNVELEKAWAHMPENAGEQHSLPSMVDANAILPHDRDYYSFNGSLTTPPVSEGVRWLVMKHIDTASKAQLETFAHTIHHPNNRPVQPLNARLIVQ